MFSLITSSDSDIHSTTSALIDVVDKLYENLDKHNKVIGIYLDFQKAFDTANHAILLHKLHNYGIRGVALDWFRNYLSGRYQYTTVNGVNSKLTAVTYGVLRDLHRAQFCF